jgi:hypothetical protein
MVCTADQTLIEDQIKKFETGGACGGKEKCIQSFGGET